MKFVSCILTTCISGVSEYRKKAEQESRMKALDGLFERLDVDCSGFIEEDELVPILEHCMYPLNSVMLPSDKVVAFGFV